MFKTTQVLVLIFQSFFRHGIDLYKFFNIALSTVTCLIGRRLNRLLECIVSQKVVIGS